MLVVEKSGVVLSCGESLVLIAGSESRKREVEVGAEGGASVAREFRACSVQECEDVLRFAGVGAVAVDNWVAMAEDTETVTE